MMVVQLSLSGDVAGVASRRKLFDGDFYGTGQWAASYDVLPDGRYFLIGRRVGAATGQLIAWVDWLGDVERKLNDSR